MLHQPLRPRSLPTFLSPFPASSRVPSSAPTPGPGGGTPDPARRMARMLWSYPATGATHMFLLTVTTALVTQSGGVAHGAWAVAATAAAPLLAVPLAALVSRPRHHGRWWLASLALAVLPRLLAVIGALAGWSLVAVLGLLFTGSVGHRVASANFKAAVSRVHSSADGIAALTVRNASAYAAAAALAGIATANLSPAALLACSLASCVFVGLAVAPVLEEGRLLARDTDQCPERTTVRPEDHSLAAVLRPVAAPALLALLLWSVVAGYASLQVVVVTDQLGPAMVGVAAWAYTLSTLGTRKVMALAGPRPTSFWAAGAVLQLLPWALVDLSPWMLPVALLVAGPTLHAAQAAVEHRVGSAVHGPLRPLAFTIGNGALVLGGVVAAPLTGWLLQHTSFTASCLALFALGTAGCVARLAWRRATTDHHTPDVASEPAAA